MNNVRLRAVEPEDIDFMYACEKDRQNMIWSDNRAPLSKNQLLTYALTYDADPFSAGQLRLIVETVKENTDGRAIINPVGILDLYDISEKDGKAYIGICIHPDFRHRGLGLSTLIALNDFNKTHLGLHQLCATVSHKNTFGQKLFIDAGFEEIAYLPEWHKVGTEFHDFHLLRKIQ